MSDSPTDKPGRYDAGWWVDTRLGCFIVPRIKYAFPSFTSPCTVSHKCPPDVRDPATARLCKFTRRSSKYKTFATQSPPDFTANKAKNIKQAMDE